MNKLEVLNTIVSTIKGVENLKVNEIWIDKNFNNSNEITKCGDIYVLVVASNDNSVGEMAIATELLDVDILRELDIIVVVKTEQEFNDPRYKEGMSRIV